MEWNVFWFDSNKGTITTRNVFELSIHFNKELKALKADNFDEFSKCRKSAAMYAFWSKAEHEIILSPWVGNGEDKKIDVFEQLRLNWKQFAEYTWRNMYGNQ